MDNEDSDHWFTGYLIENKTKFKETTAGTNEYYYKAYKVQAKYVLTGTDTNNEVAYLVAHSDMHYAVSFANKSGENDDQVAATIWDSKTAIGATDAVPGTNAELTGFAINSLTTNFADIGAYVGVYVDGGNTASSFTEHSGTLKVYLEATPRVY